MAWARYGEGSGPISDETMAYLEAVEADLIVEDKEYADAVPDAERAGRAPGSSTQSSPQDADHALDFHMSRYYHLPVHAHGACALP